MGLHLHEVRPAVLVRENVTQLLMYSLDTCVRYSTHLLIFKSQKDSMEAPEFSGNYLIDYVTITS